MPDVLYVGVTLLVFMLIVDFSKGFNVAVYLLGWLLGGQWFRCVRTIPTREKIDGLLMLLRVNYTCCVHERVSKLNHTQIVES